MPRRKQSRGVCTYCGAETALGSMSKHLDTCAKRQEAIVQAEQGKGKSETLYHLRVRSADAPDFWLDLEMRGSAQLGDLDSYLRAIWLECCGHMSSFSFERWGGEESDLNMRTKASRLLEVGQTLIHLYDFGTTSETHVKVVGTREGKPTTPHPIALMARNLMPEAVCMKCDQPATWFCQECVYEDDTSGLLCDKHVKKHPHDNYGEPLPLVNSPRLGMCGYDGPATPPY